MTTPSNVLTDADLEMLADLAPYGPKGEWFFPMDDEEAEWCERMGGLLIAANRMTPTHEGKHYKRSPLADTLLATLDHHTQQARADERRRIDDLLAMFTNKFGWMTFATHDPEFPDDDPKGPYGFGRVDTRYEEFDSMGEGASPLEALEAATTNEGTA